MKGNDLNKEYQNTFTQLKKAREELFIFYEISNAMLTTLKLEDILYIILAGVTIKEGLNFDRAFLFMINEKMKTLEGKMAIGPQGNKELENIWYHAKLEKQNLSRLVGSYKKLNKNLNKGLTDIIRKIKIPLKEDEGIPALTALENMPHKISISESRNKVNKQILDFLEPYDFVAVPLKAKGKILGVIMADNIKSHKTISQDEVKILTLFANQAGLAIENSKLYEHMKKRAERDSLTNLCNHGSFQYILNNEFKRVKRYNLKLSLLLIDIDHFKKYNDLLGHQAGDNILKKISAILLKNARTLDTVARYGGEEFAIILPQTSKEEAEKIAHRLKETVEFYNFENQDKMPNNNLTISIGLASYSNNIQKKEELIQKADYALYKAKANGRNRVIVSD